MLETREIWILRYSVETLYNFRFACGYMKHPQQSMITLIEEHGDLVDDARLVLQN